MSKNNNFRFFVPIEIEKGKKENGEESLKLKGIASTSSEDTDGEILEQGGLVIDVLKERGHLTWNHQKDPMSIIGYPTKAEVTKKGLYLEGELYKENPLAQQVYKLADIFAKNKNQRQLGWSIEGRALERDPVNEKRITKAEIYNVTITPLPKNADTFVEVMKGLNSDIRPEYEIIEKSGKKFLIEAKDPETNEVATVDVDFNIDISKAMEAGSETGQALVNQPTTGAALKKEDLEGSSKKKKKKKKEIFLEKGDVYQNIFTNFPSLKIVDANKIYNLVEDMSANNKITEEMLQKAYVTLGLKKGQEDADDDLEDDDEEYSKAYEMCKAMKDDGEEDEDIEKAMKENGYEDDMVKKAFDRYAKLSKGPNTGNSSEGDDLERIGKTKSGKKILKKSDEQEDFSEEDHKDAIEAHKDKLKKGLDDESFSTDDFNHHRKMIAFHNRNLQSGNEGVDNSLIKGLQGQIKDLKVQNVDLIKSLVTVISDINTKNIKLIKGLENQIKDLEKKIEEFAEQPVSDGKALLTKGFIEKGLGTNINRGRDNGLLTKSLTADKKELLDFIDSKIDYNAMHKGDQSQQELADMMGQYELGFPAERLIQFLSQSYNVTK